MISFQITDAKGEKLRVTAPHAWHELTMKQLMQIEDEDLQQDGLIKLFSILCGIEFDLIAESTDRTLYNRIRDVCEFIATPPDWTQLTNPGRIQIGEVIYKTPARPDTLMHGQIELITMVASTKDENLLQAMPKAVAIIMQPYMDRVGDKPLKYNPDRIEEIQKLLLDSRGIDVYGLAVFFFLKLRNFLSDGIKSSKEYQSRKIRSEQYYSDWLMLNDLIDLQT